MPRDLSKSNDLSCKKNRFSPLRRRSSSEMPSTSNSPLLSGAPQLSEEQRNDVHVHRGPAAQVGTQFAIFHSQLLCKLNEKLENNELELVSDAETLTADEGSDASNDSWSNADTWSGRESLVISESRESFGVSDSRESFSNSEARDSVRNSDSCDSYGSRASRDSSGNIYLYGRPPAPRTPETIRQFTNEGPKVVVVPIPQFDEPMEIVADDQLAPVSQYPAYYLPIETAAEPDTDEDVDVDGVSETSSYWRSDEDEEIQRACLEESEEESDEAHDEPSSGRVHRPQTESPQYSGGLSLPPTLGYAQQVQPYWPVDPLELPQGQLPSPGPVTTQDHSVPVRENNVELMDQDDQDSPYDLSTTAILHRLPTRPVTQHSIRTQYHLDAAQSLIYEREFNHLPRYSTQPQAGSSTSNENYSAVDDYLPRSNNVCNYCGSPCPRVSNEYRRMEFFQRRYFVQTQEDRHREL